MGTARAQWMTLEPHPLDFVLVPSSMGQAPSFGLGLALAQPDRQVVVCNGDGSMLMNLGSLVTITAEAPKNYTLLLFDNGVYEVTGAQATPASEATRSRGDALDFVALAKASGFTSGLSSPTSTLGRHRRAGIAADGPTFARIVVEPIPGAVGPRSPSPGPGRARAFAEALRDRNGSAAGL